MSALACAYSITDLHERAPRRLPQGLFEFVDRRAEDDLSISANVRAFQRVSLKPRMLVDVSARSLRTELFGQSCEMPIAIAPTGAARLLWHDGEMVRARAARDAGIPVVKALAMGAKAVLVDRAPLWGLACAGAAGVLHALEVLRAETDRAMGFMGCPTAASLDRTLLQPEH